MLFTHPSFDAHENVVFIHDSASSLQAIIAIHNTSLGPAVGGIRMWPYPDEQAALNDVLRLSKGMTYKNALAGVNFGGGKSVIIGDPIKDKTDMLLRAFGGAIEQLGGRYYGAEDVGTTPADLNIALEETSYLVGLEGRSGDPSPVTAFGTYLGICAAVEQRLKRSTIAGLKVAVQGVGHVGFHLCRLLHQAGAKLKVSDISRQRLSRAEAEFGADIIPLDQIHAEEVDVFAPCALGGAINDKSIVDIKAKIVAGCANNQLTEPKHAQQLFESDILYAPDYVINSGGIINVSLENHYDPRIAKKRVRKIYDTLNQIFSLSIQQHRNTAEIADEMARKIISEAEQQHNKTEHQINSGGKMAGNGETLQASRE